jgi:hypothetical protein
MSTMKTKTRPLFCVLAAVSLISAAMPPQIVSAAIAVLTAKPEAPELLQLTAGGHALGFAADGVYAATGSHALHVEFVGANDVQPQSGSAAEGEGQAAALDQVTYVGLWDGIDLAFEAEAGGIYATTYAIEPGADPADILLRYNAPLTFNEDGTLSIAFETGAMTESAPVAWQVIDGERISVEVAFQLDGQEAGFALGAYDPDLALFIDPSLTWNTFFGGDADDYGNTVAVDGSGNVYVAGESPASWGSPITRAYGGGESDAFAAKLDSSGNLVWVAFLGGIGTDTGEDIVVDGSGNVYIGGWSTRSWGSPVRAYTGNQDAFAAKLDSAGSLTWNTFLGGTLNDYGYGVAVDGSGNVYVSGSSYNTWGSPVRAYTGNQDAFAAKLTSAGALTWNTFLGGSGDDYGNGIAVDGTGNVYVGGTSYTTWGTPVVGHTGGSDGFVAMLFSSGALNWNTFMGCGSYDSIYDIAVYGSGSIYVSGMSFGTWGSPVRAYTGGFDVFAAKLASDGSRTWHTFLGGTGSDYGYGVAVDGSGNVYVSGWSGSSWGSPVRAYTAVEDAFAAKLTSAGALTWNTFLGGSTTDYGEDIAVDGSGNVYAAGFSDSSWGSPVHAFDAESDSIAVKLTSTGSLTWNTFLGCGYGDDIGNGITLDPGGFIYVVGTAGGEAFAAKYSAIGGQSFIYYLGGSGDDEGKAIALDGSGNIYVTGKSTASWGSPQLAYTGNGDAFVARISNSGVMNWNTFLGGAGVDNGNAVTVDDFGVGNVYVTGGSSATWGSPVRAYTAGWDGFAAKLNRNSGSLTWSTFLGGSGSDGGYGIAEDGAGNVVVAGGSSATWGSPVRAYTGNQDAYAAKLDSSGNLTWNTFLGSSLVDYGYAVALDGDDNVYVVGKSSATWGSPVRAYNSGGDAFAAKLTPAGALTWNTFLGGSGFDVAYGIALDDDGNLYVSGKSDAAWGSPDRAYVNGYDGFAAGVDGSGALSWNTFLGGDGEDVANGAAVNGTGTLMYSVGTSDAGWGIPVSGFTDGSDAFIIRLDVTLPGDFSKNSPAEEVYTTTDPTLSWGVSSDADSYEYCIDTSDNDTCDASWISTGTSQSAALSGLTDYTTYYWQARAVNGSGNTEADSGTWWSFTALPETFTDVPSSHWAWSWIERLFHAGITSGCGGGNYCPNNPVTRAEMAIFLERGIRGSGYTPPAATGTVFGDVPISHWAAAWIEQLYADGITSGCGGGNYCPNNPVTRAEMAIFLLRSKHGSSYTPPAATGTVFGDVPISHWAAAWIEQLYAEGITSGCGGGNYCPNSSVTRAEMAIFLVRTFDLP